MPPLHPRGIYLYSFPNKPIPAENHAVTYRFRLACTVAKYEFSAEITLRNYFLSLNPDETDRKLAVMIYI